MQARYALDILDKVHPFISWRGVAPVTMIHPRGFLTIFAAVLGAAATATLGKLSLELFPFTALVVCALPNATSRLVLAAEIPHDDASPVLHVFGVMTHRKLFHQGEDVDIVRKHVLLLFLWRFDRRRSFFQHLKFTVDFELRHEVRVLEI